MKTAPACDRNASSNKSAQQWHNSGQQPEYLLQGVRLEAATELYVKYTDELAQPVQEFVEACLAAQTQEQKRQRQQLRRARMAVGAISGLALVALGLGRIGLSPTAASPGQ
jgi:hypothetical protein